MWIYEIVNGRLSRDNALLTSGYSGASGSVNDPTKTNLGFVGPIPEGQYTMAQPVDTEEHGPYAIALIPDPANQMFGRYGFMMHGDSLQHPGQASDGCIIIARFAREYCWNSEDHQLKVVAILPIAEETQWEG